MVPRQPKEQEYLTEDEMLRLLAAPDRSLPEGFVDYITLLVLYATGIRVGDLSNLDIEDVDLKEGWVHVREGKGRDRQIAIPKAVLDDLKQYVGLRRKAKTGPFLLNLQGTRIKPWTVTKHPSLLGSSWIAETGKPSYDPPHLYSPSHSKRRTNRSNCQSARS